MHPNPTQIEARIAFTVPGRCVSKANFRRSGKGWRERWGRIKEYQETVAVYAVEAGAKRYLSRYGARPLTVCVKLYNQPGNLDTDGACKALYDALEGVAYVNDRQIVHGTQWRLRDEGERRVEMSVGYLPEEV